MVDFINSIYNRTIIFFLLPFYFLLLISCEKQTTPVTLPNPQLTLTIEDVAVTEAWLTLTVEDRTENLHFALLRNDSLILNEPLTTDDTTFYDSTLLPAHTYRAELQKEGQKIAAAGPVNITTMDTTSHNFTWQIDTLGTHSSVLHDVAIINENDIWVVGEIYVSNDSTPWRPYSAAHWNGQEWKLKRFTYISNSSELVIAPVRGIWVLSNDDIWLAAGSIFHWDGNIATLSYLRNINTQETVEKLWINSPSDIYGVGKEALVVHYNGQDWTQFTMGMNVNFYDI